MACPSSCVVSLYERLPSAPAARCVALQLGRCTVAWMAAVSDAWCPMMVTHWCPCLDWVSSSDLDWVEKDTEDHSIVTTGRQARGLREVVHQTNQQAWMDLTNQQTAFPSRDLGLSEGGNGTKSRSVRETNGRNKKGWQK